MEGLFWSPEPLALPSSTHHFYITSKETSSSHRALLKDTSTMGLAETGNRTADPLTDQTIRE